MSQSRTVAADEPAESVAVAAPVRPAERSDGAEYERVLAFFRKATWKDLAGVLVILDRVSELRLAPNARYWLGESHYGKRDYKQAIDSYDRVELDYAERESSGGDPQKGFALSCAERQEAGLLGFQASRKRRCPKVPKRAKPMTNSTN